MTTITLRGAQDGKPWEAKVEARRFAHYIGNIRYWFAYHRPANAPFGLQITHIDSGYRVCTIDNGVLMACRGDEKAAAKMQLDKLVQALGAERVRKALDNPVGRP